MTRAALAAIALIAALVPLQSKDTEPRFTDRTGPYLGEKPPGMTPEIFAPGLVSTGGFERDVAITPDGREIFFGLAGPSYQYTTVVSTRVVDGRWSEPKSSPASTTPDTFTSSRRCPQTAIRCTSCPRSPTRPWAARRATRTSGR